MIALIIWQEILVVSTRVESGNSSKKWLDSGHILKLEPTGFSDRFPV